VDDSGLLPLLCYLTLKQDSLSEGRDIMMDSEGITIQHRRAQKAEAQRTTRRGESRRQGKHPHAISVGRLIDHFHDLLHTSSHEDSDLNSQAASLQRKHSRSL
jgi:hypothetical protein